MPNKKALITGSQGFVGPYLRAELNANGYEVWGCDLAQLSTENYQSVDILDMAALESLFSHHQFDVIAHLAGFSSVKKSFSQPELTRQINVEGTKNLLQTIQRFSPQARVLIVSSAQVYRTPVHAESLKESSPLDPTTSPYAASRVEQEKLLVDFPELKIIISRSFNHTGPGQREGVVADFAQTIARLESGATMAVGNLEAARDFSDVRDVVRAYRLLLEKGVAGECYNVCSGQAVTIKDVLAMFIKLSAKAIAVTRDPAKYRPVDAPLLVGDNTKLRAITGWQPEMTLEQTLRDCYQFFFNETPPVV